MKIEFKINGNIEMHVSPENEEDQALLLMLGKRAINKGGVATISAIEHENTKNDARNGIIVSVEKNPGKPE